MARHEWTRKSKTQSRCRYCSMVTLTMYIASVERGETSRVCRDGGRSQQAQATTGNPLNNEPGAATVRRASIEDGYDYTSAGLTAEELGYERRPRRPTQAARRTGQQATIGRESYDGSY